MKRVDLTIEVLEAWIAPDSIYGLPGEANGNPGNEVSNGSEPQPSSNTADFHGTDVWSRLIIEGR